MDDFISCTIADGWTALTGVDGVYYREVGSATTAQEFNVIGYNLAEGSFVANKVLVKESVTKDMMECSNR